ncbi:MAG: glycogen debranching protein GlgX [Cyanobacteria bacterium SID2]|nr:glycogen debranching protein GlgX [Cyanobacteria bacterium SID2]MBP0002436.1 glycogen debranching protein GlgX [Cyanobacteria bacterium SBC]
MNSKVLPGHSFPLGATVSPHGTNFAVFSKYAEAVTLLLFDRADDPKPSRMIPLDPQRHKTSHYWHAFVSGIGSGQLYGYRVLGSNRPEQGLRFDSAKVLLDPYAKAVVTDTYDRAAAIRPGDNCPTALKGVVVDTSRYDWEGDRSPKTPYASTVIYELHVGGFTRHPSSGIAPEKRGTFAGLVEKIPYLQELGVTAVELLPVQQFDEADAPDEFTNYWGYSPIAFFAPHSGYSSRKDALGSIDEFRDMVKALHQAGIEVILDVVFNHTAEGNEYGPTLSYRGLANETYYILDDNRAKYRNYSGCGNTFKSHHAVVGRLILECLRYWVSEMHVDGFRFDLASVLARDHHGKPLKDPPILWAIESDPILAGTKLIAEAWDAAGLYQVGSFIGDRFAEWNGPFRDDVRRFVKSDRNTVPKLAARLLGSPDIYKQPVREASPKENRDLNRSINFITCHDGFTLNDLVSYNHKHNLANGEDNCDGSNDNYSWNGGIEGETDDPTILALRLKQAKNLMTVLLMSQGTPMLLMGDEVRRSQGGNNNAYCQDNELSWFDWRLVDRNADMLRFTRELVRFIQTRQIFQVEDFLSIGTDSIHPSLRWHGVCLGEPDWSGDSHTLAFSLRYPKADEFLYIAFNMYWKPLDFELPSLRNVQQWHRIVDTALAFPNDVSPVETASPVEGNYYALADRSSVVLYAK